MAHFIRDLQIAVRAAAVLIDPEHTAAVLIVLDVTGRELFRLPIPATVGVVEKPTEPPATVAGWDIGHGSARYDGKTVPVGKGRLKLLSVLVDAMGPLSGKELAKLVFGEHGDEEGTRFHIRKLREELQAAFGYEGDPIPNTKMGDVSGYWLAPALR